MIKDDLLKYSETCDLHTRAEIGFILSKLTDNENDNATMIMSRIEEQYKLVDTILASTDNLMTILSGIKNPHIQFATDELNRAGWNTDVEDVNLLKDPFATFGTQALNLIRYYNAMGMSGSVAPSLNNIISHLLDFKPLTPVEGNDDEWLEDVHGLGSRQNKRCRNLRKQGDDVINTIARIFTYDGDDHEGNPNKYSFTNRFSQEYVTLPYVHAEPERIHVPSKDYDFIEDPDNLLVGKMATENRLRSYIGNGLMSKAKETSPEMYQALCEGSMFEVTDSKIDGDMLTVDIIVQSLGSELTDSLTTKILDNCDISSLSFCTKHK